MNNWAKLRTICFNNDEFIDLPRNLSFEIALKHSIVYLKSIQILMDKLSCWEFYMDCEYQKSKIIINIRTFSFWNALLVLISWKHYYLLQVSWWPWKMCIGEVTVIYFTSLSDPKPNYRINLFETKETPGPVYKFIL